MGDANLPVCLPGLQGLPVQITGWDGFQEKEQILMKNDMKYQDEYLFEFFDGSNNWE